MSEAPERVYFIAYGDFRETPSDRADDVEYVRADLVSAVQPDAAAIREAALREAAEMLDKRHRGDLPAHIMSESGNWVRALINNPGKEVMPSEPIGSAEGPRNTAPAGLSAGGGAEWQPIETAKKDCYLKLLRQEDGDDIAGTVVGYWSDVHGAWVYSVDRAIFDIVEWMEIPPSAKGGATHKSDCAVHNAPAYPAGPCDCGMTGPCKWTECKAPILSAHVNETPKSEHDAGNMLTPATKGAAHD